MTPTTQTRSLPRTIRCWRIALGRMAWWKFILLLFLLTFIAKLVVIGLISTLTEFDNADIPNRAGELGWVFLVVIVPLFETLIAQSLVIGIIRKILPGAFLWPIIASGILFGCAHQISPVYLLTMVFVGLIWAFGYLSRLQGRGFASAFWLVALVHALNNSTVYLVS